MGESLGNDYPVGAAFAGASKFGIENVSIQTAGKNMSVYENCSISVTSPGVETQEDDDNDLFRRVADWLTTTTFRSIHADALEKRTPGTGLWFTDSNEYRIWTRNNVKVLWGTGMPGAGKTILSGFIVDHLQKEFSSDKRVPVVFAYCRYTEEYPTTQFFAAWIRHLLEYEPTTLRFISETFAIHQRQATSPSVAELQDLFSSMCGAFERVYIVLDGLDEAQEEVKIQLLEGINAFPSNTRTLIMSRPLKSFECLVPGVILIDIEARNEDIELFVEKKIAQMPRLRTMLSGKEGEKRRICKAIKDKSGGMFLVASLQMEALKGCLSTRALFNTLDTLPTTINDLFRDTMKRIDAQSEQDVLLAKKAILWLVYALGPLSMEQLQHALATNLDLEIFDEDDIVRGEFILDVCCGLISRTRNADATTPLRLIHYTAHDFLKKTCLSWFPTPHTTLSSTCAVYLSSELGYRVYPNGATLVFPSGRVAMRPLLHYAYYYWAGHCYRSSQEEKGPSPHVLKFISRPVHPWSQGPYFDELSSHHIAPIVGITDLLTSGEVTPKQHFNLLHLAAIGGYVNSVKTVMQRWPELSLKDRSIDGRTPLMLASVCNRVEMVKYLLSIDPDAETLNAKATCGCTALASAIARNNVKIVELLASHKGVQLNVQTCNRSPLAWAASQSHTSILQQLLSNPDVDVNAQHPFTGYTALCYACRPGRPESVKILLSREEVDIHLGPRCGCTPLILAASTNQLTIVSLLLSKPHVNIHARCIHSGTALSAAKSDAILKLLLTHERILANITPSDIHFCLLTAARLGLEDTFSKLVNKALEPAKLKMEPVVLIEAARHGHTAIVEAALRCVDVDAKDKFGWTALDAAAGAGQARTVSLLISHKASVVHAPRSSFHEPQGGTTSHILPPPQALILRKSISLALAVGRGHRDAIDALISAVMDNQEHSVALSAACEAGRDAVVRTLLSRSDIDVNVEDENGWTPLAHAAWNKWTNICEMLLSHPKIQPRAGNASPLVRAAFCGSYEIVQLLLQPAYGLDPNSTEEGWTVLSAASHSGSLPLAQMLLARDDVDVNLGKHPPLIVAAGRGHTAIIKALLAHTKTDVNVGDTVCNATALFFSCQRGAVEAVQALLRHPEVNLNIRLSAVRRPILRPRLHSLESTWSCDSPLLAQPQIYPTALHVAACSNVWHEILPLLLETKGIDPTLLNAYGESPLTLMLTPNRGLKRSLLLAFPGVLRMVASHFVTSPNILRQQPKMLERAAEIGSVDLMKALLEHCDSTINLSPALTSAIRAGHSDIINLLLDVPGVDINHGEPALAVACFRQGPAVIKLLFGHPGVDLNLQSSSGYTPLAAACCRGHHEVVSWLLSRKDINVNAGKYHPLMLAVQAGQRRVVAQLIESPTDLDVDQYAYDPEVSMLPLGFLRAIPRPCRRFDVKDCWLKNTAFLNNTPNPVLSDPIASKCYGRLAARRIGPYVIGLSSGPELRPNALIYHLPPPGPGSNRQGDPILVFTLRSSKVGMSEAILSHHSVKINARARCGCTALIVGSFLRRHTILDRIIARADTDPTICCPTHGTAVLAAAHRLYFDTVNKIISSPLRSKLDLHEAASCGCNLFICAARSGDEETFLSFLPLTNWQESPNIVDCKFGRTALHWASFHGYESAIQLLLSNPVVDLTHRDKHGNDALILAAESGREEVVRSLLASPGIYLNARNANGDTALSSAMWYGHERIVRLLLARNDVDVSLVDSRPGRQH
ncbi:hypothetical protein MD484_g8488, partial [Candolleomyces efflorescens]